MKRPNFARLSAFFGIAILALTPVARGSMIDAFGLPHTSLGNATLTQGSTGLTVSNLGSSGQDGVAVDLSNAGDTGPSFSWDAAVTDLGTHADGSYMQVQSVAIFDDGNGNVTRARSTFRETQTSSSSFSLTADVSQSWDGQPLTINYYGGGANGTVVYSETYNGATPSIAVPSRSGWFPTLYLDSHGSIFSKDFSISGGWDPSGGIGEIITAGGVDLPASDNIDLIDIVAPTSLQPSYSLVDVTAGGGDISSFTITGEAIVAPEPATLALVGLGAVGLLIFASRRNSSALAR